MLWQSGPTVGIGHLEVELNQLETIATCFPFRNKNPPVGLAGRGRMFDAAPQQLPGWTGKAAFVVGDLLPAPPRWPRTLPVQGAQMSFAKSIDFCHWDVSTSTQHCFMRVLDCIGRQPMAQAATRSRSALGQFFETGCPLLHHFESKHWDLEHKQQYEKHSFASPPGCPRGGAAAPHARPAHSHCRPVRKPVSGALASGSASSVGAAVADRFPGGLGARPTRRRHRFSAASATGFCRLRPRLRIGEAGRVLLFFLNRGRWRSLLSAASRSELRPAHGWSTAALRTTGPLVTGQPHGVELAHVSSHPWWGHVEAVQPMNEPFTGGRSRS